MLAQHQLSAELALDRWHPLEEAWEDVSVPMPDTAEQRATEHQRLVDTETQDSLAAGQAGWEVRVELRSGSTRIPLGGNGDKEALIALAEEQIGKLRDRIERVLDACHTTQQAEAIAGMFSDEDAVTKGLRKDESRARSDYNKALGLLLAGRAEAEAAGTSTDKPDGIPPVPQKASVTAVTPARSLPATETRSPK